MVTIPNSFSSRITELYGQAGTAWINNLPTLIHSICQRWHITIKQTATNLSYHYVLFGHLPDDTQIALKLGIPNEELIAEANALTFFAGQGVVELLVADLEKGALLLERLHPGTTLEKFFPSRDEEVVTIAVQCMRNLWRPV